MRWRPVQGDVRSSTWFSENARVEHHALELGKVYSSVSISVDGIDHAAAVFYGQAFLPQARQNAMQFVCRDEAVSINVEHMESCSYVIPGIACCAVRSLNGFHGTSVEIDKLLKIDESIAISVHFVHHFLKLFVCGLDPERMKDEAQLRGWDLAVAVHIEVPERFCQLFRAVERCNHHISLLLIRRGQRIQGSTRSSCYPI